MQGQRVKKMMVGMLRCLKTALPGLFLCSFAYCTLIVLFCTFCVLNCSFSVVIKTVFFVSFCD